MRARILVVDDDPSTRLIFRLIFESAGYEVEEAPNGAIALSVVGEGPPDLLVTDILMPVMDGLALISRLRSQVQTAALPIVAVSGNPDAQEAAAWADAVIAKPFDRGQLLEVVSSLLAQREARSRLAAS
jgi:CheY-like chemotaxis protein